MTIEVCGIKMISRQGWDQVMISTREVKHEFVVVVVAVCFCEWVKRGFYIISNKNKDGGEILFLSISLRIKILLLLIIIIIQSFVSSFVRQLTTTFRTSSA